MTKHEVQKALRACGIFNHELNDEELRLDGVKTNSEDIIDLGIILNWYDIMYYINHSIEARDKHEKIDRQERLKFVIKG